MPRLKHADLEQMGDESFVEGILHKMDGDSNYAKAIAIVKGLRKRMRDRYRSDLRMKAEREGTSPHIEE